MIEKEWRYYEKEVLAECKRIFRNCYIDYDIAIKGMYSKRKRQIDVYVKDNNGSIYIFDAKKYNKKIDVKIVESFISMVKDVGADYGVLVSEKGFTKAAQNRAHYGEKNIEVDILSLNDLKLFQSRLAIPYAGNNGVIAVAPFGWIIDGTRRDNMVATLYQRGLSFEDAARSKEWAYVNFWEKTGEINSLDKLISWQNSYLLEVDPKGIIEEKDDGLIWMRSFESKMYPTKEITLFRDFKDFILMVVLFSPDNLINRNINKIRYFLSKAYPVSIQSHNKN